jgi:tetratricopeptide (TPR) repeat protein
MTALVTLTDAAKYYDHTGRVEQADAAVQRVLKCVKHLPASSWWDRRFLLAFAKHLEETKRNADAESVWNALIPAAGKPDIQKEESLSALRPYAKFLAKQGRCEEAEKAYERIIKLSPQSNLRSDVVDAGEFFSSIGKHDKAASLYAKYTADASMDLGDPEQNFYRRQEKLQVLYKPAK